MIFVVVVVLGTIYRKTLTIFRGGVSCISNIYKLPHQESFDTLLEVVFVVDMYHVVWFFFVLSYKEMLCVCPFLVYKKKGAKSTISGDLPLVVFLTTQPEPRLPRPSLHKTHPEGGIH
jgi:hypothetical protein